MKIRLCLYQLIRLKVDTTNIDFPKKRGDCRICIHNRYNQQCVNYCPVVVYISDEVLCKKKDSVQPV